MSAQTVFNKFSSLGTQIVLAWFLLKSDFGLLGLASSAYSLTAILVQTGLQQILIRRQKHFLRWQTAAISLSVFLGLVGLLATLLAAPIAAKLYGEPRLIPLLFVQSLILPAISLNAVASAKLQIDMRFKLAAGISIATSLITNASSICFAILHFGPFSIVLAQLIATYSNTIACWTYAGIRPKARLHFRRWRYLIGDTRWLMGNSAFITLVAQGDYMILGLTQSTEVVGIYYFAYNLSTQVTQLVTVNLAGVLLPVLAKFKANDSLQIKKFLDATEVMALFGVPLCLFQAMLVRPAVELVYGSKWISAIPTLQLLSLAMIPVVIGGHNGTLFQAQGRFRTNFALSVVSAILFLSVIATASRFGGATAVAGGVIVAYSSLALLGMAWATGFRRDAAIRLIRIGLPPVVAGTLAALIAYGIARLGASFSTHYNAVYIAVVAIVFPMLYLTWIRFWRPTMWYALYSRLQRA